MSTRHNNRSHSENYELQDGASEQWGKQDHLTGNEQSRQAPEPSQGDRQHTQTANAGHGTARFGHDDIAVLAHRLWQARGCPDGSPQEDWFHAVEELRSRAYTVDPALGDHGCPKCGAEMEDIEMGVEGPALEHLELCPGCYLVMWSDKDGLHVRQGVPMKKGISLPSETTWLAGEPEEC